MKVSDSKNWINGCSKEFARLAQGRKKYKSIGTKKLFLFIQNNEQITKNQPTFASAHIFDHRNNILTIYN